MVVVRSVLALALLGPLISCDDPPTGPRAPIPDLPADLAAVEFSAAGRPTAPYTMLEIRHEDGFNGFVAVNGDGRPVWYFRTTGGPSGFTRRGNGNLVLLDSERGLVEVTPAGDVVSELSQEERPGRRMHHDVIATPHGTVLFLAEERRFIGEDTVTGDGVWEWVPETGAVDRRWTAFDHLDWDHDRGTRSRADDWLHANSLHLGPRGNLVVSLHFLNQVISIEAGFTGLEWRLGGTRATIPVGDPFSGQHTAQEVSDGRVLLFDNGFEREVERYSRAAEYSIGSGTKAWEWRPERDNWARVISGVRPLPGGHALVTFGTPEGRPAGSTGPIEVYEVSRAGDVVWHLQLGGAVSSNYRATPLFEL
jgi:hypothetical protein